MYNNNGMVNYDRIVRECFWDLKMSREEIEQILSGDGPRLKRQLFEKILLNSSHYLLDLQLFDREELGVFLEEFRPPAFNYDYAFRRKNIAEVFFFDKELKINELKWPA